MLSPNINRRYSSVHPCGLPNKQQKSRELPRRLFQILLPMPFLTGCRSREARTPSWNIWTAWSLSYWTHTMGRAHEVCGDGDDQWRLQMSRGFGSSTTSLAGQCIVLCSKESLLLRWCGAVHSSRSFGNVRDRAVRWCSGWIIHSRA